jgi:hypothetical protein
MQRSCVTCLSISTRRTKHTRLVLFEHLRAVWFAIHVYTISMHHRPMQLAAVRGSGCNVAIVGLAPGHHRTGQIHVVPSTAA